MIDFRLVEIEQNMNVIRKIANLREKEIIMSVHV